jgi:hypothetical protein
MADDAASLTTRTSLLLRVRNPHDAAASSAMI